jgi:hypothetical protein
MDVDVEIEALRIRFGTDSLFYPSTDKQIGYLNSLMSKSLEDKNNRKPVISKIVGHTISTTHQLTRWVASILIETLQDEDGKSLVRAIESTVKAQAIL